jgi:hypothetical protein
MSGAMEVNFAGLRIVLSSSLNLSEFRRYLPRQAGTDQGEAPAVLEAPRLSNRKQSKSFVTFATYNTNHPPNNNFITASQQSRLPSLCHLLSPPIHPFILC